MKADPFWFNAHIIQFHSRNRFQEIICHLDMLPMALVPRPCLHLPFVVAQQQPICTQYLFLSPASSPFSWLLFCCKHLSVTERQWAKLPKHLWSRMDHSQIWSYCLLISLVLVTLSTTEGKILGTHAVIDFATWGNLCHFIATHRRYNIMVWLAMSQICHIKCMKKLGGVGVVDSTGWASIWMGQHWNTYARLW